jgi:hypothetical protein
VDNNKYPAWVDITAKDAEASRTFYSQLFGWRIPVLEAIDYGVVESGPDTLPGGIGQQDDQRPAGIVTYFSVDDVEASLARAEELGGKVAVPPWEIPGLGKMAIFLDPDGNRVGLWKD